MRPGAPQAKGEEGYVGVIGIVAKAEPSGKAPGTTLCAREDPSEEVLPDHVLNCRAAKWVNKEKEMLGKNYKPGAPATGFLQLVAGAPGLWIER